MIAQFDLMLYRALAAPPGLGGAGLFAAIMLARWVILLPPAVLGLVFLASPAEGRRAIVGAALASLVAVGAAGVLSSLIFEPRPFMLGLAANRLDHAGDSGFPSDHATALFAIAWSLRFRPIPSVPKAWAFVLAVAVAVGAARVVLGVHFPIDVIGACGVALIAAAIVATPAGRRLTDTAASLADVLARRLGVAMRRCLSHRNSRGAA